MYFNITQILKSRTFITNWMSLPLYPDFNYIGMLKKFKNTPDMDKFVGFYQFDKDLLWPYIILKVKVEVM